MYKSLIVGAVLAALYVFAIVYFGPYIALLDKIIFAVPIIVGIIIYVTKVEAWIEEGRFWAATILMLVACIIVLWIGAQGKVDAPSLLIK
jgi:hypothetical protein